MVKQQRKTTSNDPTTASQSQSSQEQLTFLEHVYELRTRLFWVLASLVAASSVGYYFKDLLIAFIKAPLGGEKLIYLTPGGGFSFIFTICLYFGVLLTIPVIMYQLYRFLQPVFGKTSRKLIAVIILLSSLLAAAGALFGYFVAIPAAIEFLTTFAGDAVAPSLTADSYLGFVVAYMLGLAVLFQLPLLLYIIDYVRPFPPGALWSSQRFVVAGAVIAAAVITPTPDIINQAIVAGPIILVYQLGAVAVYIRHKSMQRSARVVSGRSKLEDARAAQDNVPEEDITDVKKESAIASSPVVPSVQRHQPSPSARIERKVPSTNTRTKPQQSMKPMTRRSIDGFAPRPAQSTLRTAASERSAAPRRLRSVDGMSFI